MATAAAITVKAANIATIIGMINRGDRHHDIAAWFGLVVGRLAKDPLTGRRLKPDAMAIENPAGFRIERLETGMGGKRAYDHRRARLCAVMAHVGAHLEATIRRPPTGQPRPRPASDVRCLRPWPRVIGGQPSARDRGQPHSAAAPVHAHLRAAAPLGLRPPSPTHRVSTKVHNFTPPTLIGLCARNLIRTSFCIQHWRFPDRFDFGQTVSMQGLRAFRLIDHSQFV